MTCGCLYGPACSTTLPSHGQHSTYTYEFPTSCNWYTFNSNQMSSSTGQDFISHTIHLSHPSRESRGGQTYYLQAVNVEYPNREDLNRRFPSVSRASQELGIPQSNIEDAIKGRVSLQTIFPIQSRQDQSSKSSSARQCGHMIRLPRTERDQVPQNLGPLDGDQRQVDHHRKQSTYL